MIGMLAWLTISLPYVYEANRLAAETQTEEKAAAAQNPLANTNEENNNPLFSASEEFLHDAHHELDGYVVLINSVFFHKNESAYIAFHGELISPPPDLSC
jgi:hypothetical protein